MKKLARLLFFSLLFSALVFAFPTEGAPARTSGSGVASFTPTGKVANNVAFKVTFTDPMVSQKEVGKSLPVEEFPFVVTPAVQAEGKWLDQRTFSATLLAPLDMATVYSDLIINLQEILFAKEGAPDGVYYYEDMGFKERPFMSPRMYRELLFPAHKKTCDFAKSKNLPVIMHSCGFIEPLLPDMIKAGIDCLQAIEIKAGMDLLKIYKDYGDVLSFMGGLDVRVLYSNDLAAVEKMLVDHIPIVKQGFGYCLFSDHSIPNTVEYKTYKFFLERGLELGQY